METGNQFSIGITGSLVHDNKINVLLCFKFDNFCEESSNLSNFHMNPRRTSLMTL